MHPLLPRSFVVTFQRALCCSLLFLCGEPPTAQCSVLSSDLPRSCQGHPPRCVLGWLCCGREWLCPCGCHTALHVCTLAVHSQPEAPLCPPSLSSIFLVNRCVAGRFLWTLWGGLYSFSFSPCLLSRFLVCCVSMEGSSLYLRPEGFEHGDAVTSKGSAGPGPLAPWLVGCAALGDLLRPAGLGLGTRVTRTVETGPRMRPALSWPPGLCSCCFASFGDKCGPRRRRLHGGARELCFLQV